MRLFSQRSLGDLLRHHLAEVQTAIASLDHEYVLKASAAELENYFHERARVNALQIDRDHREIKSQDSIKKDVSRDFRYGHSGAGKVMVNATKVQIAVPDTGDRGLW